MYCAAKCRYQIQNHINISSNGKPYRALPPANEVSNRGVPSQRSIPSPPVSYQLVQILFHCLCYVSYLTPCNRTLC